MRRHGPIVVTDSTSNRFHATPWSREHLIEDRFLTK
jgi:hypothetical protein